jgi:hypothetical protein
VAVANRWNVEGPVGPAKYIVTVRRSSATTRSRVGSETASRPAGTTVDGDRPNFSRRSEPGRTDAPWPALPIDAPVSRAIPGGARWWWPRRHDEEPAEQMSARTKVHLIRQIAGPRRVDTLPMAGLSV